MRDLRENRKPGIPVVGALIAAVGASLCCGGPLVFLVAGAGGACIASLGFLNPYRPYFGGISLLFLGIAFYQVYRRPEGNILPTGSYCPYPRKGKYNKVLLWVATVIIIVFLLFPYVHSN